MCHRGNSGHLPSYIDFTSGCIWTSGMRLHTSLSTATNNQRQDVHVPRLMAAYCKGCSSPGLQSIAQFVPISLTTVVVVQSCPTLQYHGLQHARLPCPSPSPGVCSNSCPLNWWCHPSISSSVGPFSSCLQSFPASGSFPVSQLFIPGGQSIGSSASASVLPMNIQGWFPLGLTGLKDSQESSQVRGAGLLKAQKGPGKAFKEAIPCPATPWVVKHLLGLLYSSLRKT